MSSKRQKSYAGSPLPCPGNPSLQCFVRLFLVVLVVWASLAWSGLAAAAQNSHPAHGAMSQQEMARMASPLVSGSTDADQVCARSAVGSIVPAPAELKSTNGVLELTFNFKSVTDAQGLLRYCFVTDTGIQSPTLRVNPGDKLVIHFNNQLAVPSAMSDSSNMAGMNMALSTSADPGSACDGAMGANVTNMHFHGLNVAPVCGQDEVLRTLVQPGQSFDYTVQIPANEPPGLYWYHPHPHGISELQVQGGATGALIVEGLQNVDTSLAGLNERTFVLRDQLLPASAANEENVPAWDLSINYVPVPYPSYTPAVIQTNPGQKELWRVANTGADTIIDLQYLVNGTPQPVQVVAIDGFPIAAGSSGLKSENETSILLAPGARAEFVVTTPGVGDKSQLVTQYWNTGPDGDYDPARPIADIVSQNNIEASPSATPAAQPLPYSTASHKVTRFADLAATTPVAQRNLYFSEVLLDPTDPLSPTTFYITEQGQTPAAFTMGQPSNIIVHAGNTEDWVIENRSEEDHIFHIHQLHFQLLEQNGRPVSDPALRDTVDVPFWSGSGPYPSVKVRMDFRDPNIVGAFVYHCHILAHEDGGMMGIIQVLPAGSASAVSATASASSIDPNGNITLTATVVDAATGSPQPTGVVQFELNGVSIGNPAAILNGKAALTTPINGPAGTGSVTAFYQGDSTYTESVSPSIPLKISSFVLTSPGSSAAIGTASSATVTVDVATDYTSPIRLGCTLPSTLTEAACFVNPTAITGTGAAKLIVNTTPAHPLSSALRRRGFGWFAERGGITLACFGILIFPARRRQLRSTFLFALAAVILTSIGCGSKAAKTDPGTPAGMYTVIVTGTSGTGSSLIQASVNVPVTIQPSALSN